MGTSHSQKIEKKVPQCCNGEGLAIIHYKILHYLLYKKHTMDFSFSLNDTFPPTNCNGLPNRLHGSTIAYGDIIKVGSDLLPEGGSNLGIKTMHSVQQRVSDILDAMGQASAVAQELRQPITSGAKLRMQDEHVVYLLIDRSSNGGFRISCWHVKSWKKESFST